MSRRAPRQQPLALSEPGLTTGYEVNPVPLARIEALPPQRREALYQSHISPLGRRVYKYIRGETTGMVWFKDCPEVDHLLGRGP